MLDHVGIKRLRLMTNNPRKVVAMEQLGFEVADRIALRTGQNPHNARYLATKVGKLGHLLGE
jgi:GTP cyclohydrolase II